MKYCFWLAVLIIIGISSSSAGAHVRVFVGADGIAAPTCSYVKFVTRVPVEKPLATTRIDLMIPPSIRVVDVQPKPGWHANLTMSKGYVVQITWDGGKLYPHEFDEFAFLGATPKKPQTVDWNALQTYEDGSVVRWTGQVGSNQPHSQTRIVATACRKR